MPKKNTPSRALVPAPAQKLYPIDEATIEPTQLVIKGRRHPFGDGPWKHEPDKIAWIDASTGLACTVLRKENGVLSGYVGLTPDHPLFGFFADAIPSMLGMAVHGGLNYAAACDERGPEDISVCHPSDAPDDALWWLGFSCDHGYDYVPDRAGKPLAEENGQAYRTEAYVYRETVKLARQLKAISEGDGAAGVAVDVSTSIPPIGLDPEGRS